MQILSRTIIARRCVACSLPNAHRHTQRSLPPPQKKRKKEKKKRSQNIHTGTRIHAHWLHKRARVRAYTHSLSLTHTCNKNVLFFFGGYKPFYCLQQLSQTFIIGPVTEVPNETIHTHAGFGDCGS